MKKSKIYVALILSIVLVFNVNISVYAEKGSFASQLAWKDDAGNVIFATYDHHSTSKTYHTIGITVTRCILGEQKMSPAGEYIAFAFDSDCVQTSEEISGGFIKTLFTIPEEKFLSRIASWYPSWLTDLQCGKPCYIKIDSIMCCREWDNNLQMHKAYGSGSTPNLLLYMELLFQN